MEVTTHYQGNIQEGKQYKGPRYPLAVKNSVNFSLSFVYLNSQRDINVQLIKLYQNTLFTLCSHQNLVVKIMSELQEVAIFNSDTQSDQMYVPRSRLQKLVTLFKKWWILILLFTLVFCFVFVITCRYEAQIKDLKETLDTNVDNIRDTLKNISQEIDMTQVKFESEINDVIDLVGSLDEQMVNQTKEFSEKIEFQSRAASARSCRELRDHGFLTGIYRIDPDGRYGGVSSFEAECNFDHEPEGVTMIRPFEVIFTVTNNHTNEIDVKYGPSMEQIETLIQNSGSCHQTIFTLCHDVKKSKIVNFKQFWWLDKLGKLYVLIYSNTMFIKSIYRTERNNF